MNKDSENLIFSLSFNAHGMYETMRFVLRLSPVNHELINSIDFGIDNTDDISPEQIKAYSTYIHETIHWWQHVGSTSGLLLSLSYLGQSYSTIGYLRKVITAFGPIKPLLRWTDEVLLHEGSDAQEKLADANVAVNNILDINYYRSYAINPKMNINYLINDIHFESVGHCYSVAYGQLLGMLATTIDDNFETIPNAIVWDREFLRLNEQKYEGFYWNSPVYVPSVGLKAIYEGQARFIQLQFLSSGRSTEYSCQYWRSEGYFDGVYVEAFEHFLELSGSDWPIKFEDPIIGLFLLVCDLSINPTRGIPLDIENFISFIDDVDVGIRFLKFSSVIKQLPHLKSAMVSYSKEEYISISSILTSEAGYDHPIKALEVIEDWTTTASGLKILMEEYKNFRFSLDNTPLRVFISHFISFSADRLKRPEFFCWAGKWMTDAYAIDEVMTFWLRHLSLFSDRPDKPGVYPRSLPDRDEVAIKETFKNFYSNMALYDLTLQWVIGEGPFVFDYRWLMENYSQEGADRWANDTFKSVYGISLNDFKILPKR